MFRLNNKGFSLVELMVVVAIIGILSSIAIPSINKYMAKARQSEAKTNLASIYTANKAFFAEYNMYDNRFRVIGYIPEGRMRYNVGWATAGTRCDLTAAGYTGDTTDSYSSAVYCGTTGTITGTQTCTVLADGNQTLTGSALSCTTTGVKSFTAAAAGRISSGTTIDRWTMTQAKVLTNSADGTQ